MNQFSSEKFIRTRGKANLTNFLVVKIPSKSSRFESRLNRDFEISLSLLQYILPQLYKTLLQNVFAPHPSNFFHDFLLGQNRSSNRKNLFYQFYLLKKTSMLDRNLSNKINQSLSLAITKFPSSNVGSKNAHPFPPRLHPIRLE